MTPNETRTGELKLAEVDLHGRAAERSSAEAIIVCLHHGFFPPSQKVHGGGCCRAFEGDLIAELEIVESSLCSCQSGNNKRDRGQPA